MVAVSLRNLSKSFGSGANATVAVDDVNLEIEEGEFFALLGPSGCGKTTTMRCVAGFERPTQGEIWVGERLINDVPPHKRDTGMVFQSYALFPHYDVFQNVAYGLLMRDLYKGRIRAFAGLFSKRAARSSADIRRQVNEALEQVGLTGYDRRQVSQLSGGQQQRVALARALVRRPAVLLMDEPLSNLDKNLRIQMRTTIREIQREVGITTIFVTHDQEEAMGMADRIALMRDGRLEQVDTPTALYARPNSAWAARFVGSSNLVDTTVERSDDTRTEVVLGGRNIRIPASEAAVGEQVRLLMRPEALSVQAATDPNQNAENTFPGTIADLTYLGPNISYTVDIGAAGGASVVPAEPTGNKAPGVAAAEDAAQDGKDPDDKTTDTEALDEAEALEADALAAADGPVASQLIEVTDTFRGADALLDVGTPVQVAIEPNRITLVEEGSS